MRLRFIAVALVVLALCYFGAGAPAMTLLLKPAIVGDGLALKSITYHWANRADRAIPETELLASRFYVLLFAAVTVGAALSALKADRDIRRFAFAFGWSIVLFGILVYAQMQAFYTVG
ncbi:hypothetical protein [Paraburkholderia kururiensis]|uniref:Uncharacterized protein n=1 Tax=Paraburkholderia kururiensis TaxID=984307 RepID=A0ABZ0WQ65_9BURK|nr:hypothetical protein [Paraburkholderia kururiensis]WQD79381.1 hypothetical protein U0042_06680 [Paraburkholderia kururiensis]